MAEGYVLNTSGSLMINGVAQMVAELQLPPGNYLVFAKANVFISHQAIMPNGGGEARLVVGNQEDRVMSNLHRDGFDGGNWAAISLMLGVQLEQGGWAQLQYSAGYDNSIGLSNVKLSAIALDAMHITESRIGEAPYHHLDSRLFTSMHMPYFHDVR